MPVSAFAGTDDYLRLHVAEKEGLITATSEVSLAHLAPTPRLIGNSSVLHAFDPALLTVVQPVQDPGFFALKHCIIHRHTLESTLSVLSCESCHTPQRLLEFGSAANSCFVV